MTRDELLERTNNLSKLKNLIDAEIRKARQEYVASNNHFNVGDRVMVGRADGEIQYGFVSVSSGHHIRVGIRNNPNNAFWVTWRDVVEKV